MEDFDCTLRLVVILGITRKTYMILQLVFSLEIWTSEAFLTLKRRDERHRRRRVSTGNGEGARGNLRQHRIAEQRRKWRNR